MAEAESMADWVAVLVGGRLVAQGSSRKLTASGDGLTRISVCTVNNSVHGLSVLTAVRKTEDGDYSIYLTHSEGPSVAFLIVHIGRQRMNSSMCELSAPPWKSASWN